MVVAAVWTVSAMTVSAMTDGSVVAKLKVSKVSTGKAGCVVAQLMVVAGRVWAAAKPACWTTFAP